jgi:chorismate dehydratase
LITAQKEKIRISVVSYLNSKPFIYGLNASNLAPSISIEEDIPSVCAQKLKSGVADIGLIPVIALTENKAYTIISDYCIGADGPVNSVLLLSAVPLNEIRSVLLDYQSRTSVKLAQVLAKNYWGINPEWLEAETNYETLIKNTCAGVVIGDRALQLKNKFPFVYDLSGEWKKATGLPFVFACWVSNRTLDKDFIDSFNAALSYGLKKINTVAEKEHSLKFTKEEVIEY